MLTGPDGQCRAWTAASAASSAEGLFDPLADDIFLAADAVQVDLVRDAGAVAGLSWEDWTI